LFLLVLLIVILKIGGVGAWTGGSGVSSYLLIASGSLHQGPRGEWQSDRPSGLRLTEILASTMIMFHN
jgi:hypothetical protein